MDDQKPHHIERQLPMQSPVPQQQPRREGLADRLLNGCLSFFNSIQLGNLPYYMSPDSIAILKHHRKKLRRWSRDYRILSGGLNGIFDRSADLKSATLRILWRLLKTLFQLNQWLLPWEDITQNDIDIETLSKEVYRCIQPDRDGSDAEFQRSKDPSRKVTHTFKDHLRDLRKYIRCLINIGPELQKELQKPLPKLVQDRKHQEVAVQPLPSPPPAPPTPLAPAALNSPVHQYYTNENIPYPTSKPIIVLAEPNWDSYQRIKADMVARFVNPELHVNSNHINANHMNSNHINTNYINTNHVHSAQEIAGTEARLQEFIDSGIGESPPEASAYVEPPVSSDSKPMSAGKRKRKRRLSLDEGSDLTEKPKSPVKKVQKLSKESTSVEPRHFVCALADYGCTSAFSSKNEWKRHVSIQHIRLGFWRCDLCPEPDKAPNDFNRKDLFTQHLRRIHQGTTASDAEVTDYQTRCYKKVRDPPQKSNCLFCNRKFQGQGSWDERLEHVGRHMEKNKKDGNERYSPGDWLEDADLREWLVQEGLMESDGNGGWRLVKATW